MTKSLALEGQSFGRLLVLDKAGKTPRGAITWRCKCDCGNETIVIGSLLKRGTIKSCGCLLQQRRRRGNVKHNKYKSPEYSVYRSMLKRCYNKNNTNYRSYGAKGVTVCDRWNPKVGGCFENFLQDMGYRPSPDHQLDKEAVDVNNTTYCPEYCRWVHKSINQRNKRVITVTYQGASILLADLARALDINYVTLRSRIKSGWPESRWGEPPSCRGH